MAPRYESARPALVRYFKAIVPDFIIEKAAGTVGTTYDDDKGLVPLQDEDKVEQQIDKQLISDYNFGLPVR